MSRGAFVREWPGPSETTFVCLHATAASSAHWLAVGDSLARRGTVVAPDLAGFGRTPAGPPGAAVEAQRALLAELLRRTGPAIVVGSSFGALVALLQAAADPRSVRGVVSSGGLLQPAIDGRSARAAFASFVGCRLRRRAARIASLDWTAARRPDELAMRGLRSVVFDPEALDPAVVAETAAVARGQRVPAAARAVRQAGWSSMRLLADADRLRGVISRVSCPVLVIHGRQDPVVPVGYALEAARTHPHWTVRVVESTGHLPHLERPDEWVEIVSGWTADQVPRAAAAR